VISGHFARAEIARSSPIQTLLSAAGISTRDYRIYPQRGLAGFHRRSGISCEQQDHPIPKISIATFLIYRTIRRLSFFASSVPRGPKKSIMPDYDQRPNLQIPRFEAATNSTNSLPGPLSPSARSLSSALLRDKPDR